MKKIALATISLLMIAGQSCAMQPVGIRAGIKAITPFLKKGFSGAMTGLHWTIAAGIPLTQAGMQTYYYYNQKKIIDSYPNTDKTVTQFIESSLPTVSIDSIKINPIPSSLGGNWGCFNKSILISPAGHNALKKSNRTRRY